MRQIGQEILVHLFTGYLKLLEKTVNVQWAENSMCGGSALRVPDGFASFGALKGILQNAYERTRSIAVALDGPLGPRHEPKKLAFYLSEQAQEDFVGISVSYSSKLRLGWRWDKYVIPLPFSTVTVAAHNYGEVDKKHIPELPTSANAPECGILVKEI